MADTSTNGGKKSTRRQLLRGAGAVAGTVAVSAAFAPLLLAEDKLAPVAASASPAATPPWMDTVKAIIGNHEALTGKIQMELPEIAENGNTVPFNFNVESPMSEADYVKALHVVSTGNPVPLIAAFEFTPLSGKAQVSSRMRLGQTQEVVAIAEMSDGKFYMNKRTVKVTIGGCGG